MPLPLVIWITYIQTFLLFPGVNIEEFTYYYVSKLFFFFIYINHIKKLSNLKKYFINMF